MALPNASQTAAQYNQSCSLNIAIYLLARQNSAAIYMLMGVANILFSTSASLGNILIFFALRNSTSLHSASKAIFYSLALSDFGIGLVAQPLFAAYILAIASGSARVFCAVGLLFSLFGSFLALVSVWTMMVSALDRYLALQLRFRYREVVKLKRIVPLLVTGWILALFCTSSRALNNTFRQIITNLVLFSCLLTTSYFYIKSFFNLRRQRVQNQALNSFTLSHYRTSLTSMVIVFCFFLVTYFPFICALAATTVFGYSSLTLLALDITSLLGLANSSLNPIVYCWRIREIRRETLIIIRKLRSFCPSCPRKSTRVNPL